MTRRSLLLPLLLSLACSPRAPGTAGDRARTDPPSPEAMHLASPGSPSETETPRDPRETALAAVVTGLLEEAHLKKKKLDDGISREAWKGYIKDLDPTKAYLLTEDVATLEKYRDQIDDELHAGRLDLAHEGTRILTNRVAQVEKIVAELLAKPLNLDDDETIETDPDKLAPPKDLAELRERWRQRLELEVLERVSAMEDRLAKKTAPAPAKGKPTPPPASGAATPPGVPPDDDEAPGTTTPLAEIPPTPEARQAKVRAELATAYAGRFARLRSPHPLDSDARLINAVAATYDPHTNYLPPSDKANFDIQMSGSLEGIGAVLRERDHYTEVAEIVPGGASWRQGRLTVGDLILSVQAPGQPPVDVTDMQLDDVVKMIRGPKGTVVTLRIRKASGEEETLAITRDKVVIEEAYARGAVLTPPAGKQKFGYIYLPSFYGGNGEGQRTAGGDVRRLLEKLRAAKVDGVIIDLRSNGGGLLAAAVEITGLLVDKGPVVQVEDSRNRREVLDDEQRGTAFDGPVVVMVDRFSASAAEILAAALQDYHRAVIVGTGATHGKGTVQTLADLDRVAGQRMDLGVLKLTIQQFFRVNGASTQREGVTPDVVLPDPVGFVETGERELEHALPWSKIDPVLDHPLSVKWDKATLAAHSAARVAKDATLAKVDARSQLMKTWRDDTKIPLSRTAFDARKKTRRAALEVTAPDLDKATPRFSVKMVEEMPTVAGGPGGRTDDRPAKWREALSKDPWVAESLSVLGDISRR